MYFNYTCRAFRPPPELSSGIGHTAVAIVGGGPTGLTLALALALRGIPSVMLEADATVCQGSRATCVSRRSLEILTQLCAGEQFMSKGLAWTGGRSFYRAHQVLQFEMPTDQFQQHPPMVNLQQCYTEQFILDALDRQPQCDQRWQSRVVDVKPGTDSIVLRVATPAGDYELDADWVIACDGAHSVARKALDLRFKGNSYEGRYVIVDIKLKSHHPVVERRVWFDPPTNRGSTIIMHRQPDDIWRVDYQLRDDEDAEQEVKPERVIPRVRRHLQWIGEGDDWEVEWISIYRASSLTLDKYCHGRILFAGEAAHLLPIFGVRGMNSCIDDAHNLAWKLAYMIEGRAAPDILDSYSDERQHAAQQNMRQADKSTYFMTPPSTGHARMRDAALSLAVTQPFARALINPRQTTPIAYPASSLSTNTAQEKLFSTGPAPGDLMLNLPGKLANDLSESQTHLLDLLGRDFVLLVFVDALSIEPLLSLAEVVEASHLPCRIIAVCRGDSVPAAKNALTLIDHRDCLFARYGAAVGTTYLLRPDNYVAARWQRWEARADQGALLKAMHRAVGAPAPVAEGVA